MRSPSGSIIGPVGFGAGVLPFEVDVRASCCWVRAAVVVLIGCVWHPIQVRLCYSKVGVGSPRTCPAVAHETYCCGLLSAAACSACSTALPHPGNCMLHAAHLHDSAIPTLQPDSRNWPHGARPQVITDSQPGPNGEARPFYDFLESCLRHKGELVGAWGGGGAGGPSGARLLLFAAVGQWPGLQQHLQ